MKVRLTGRGHSNGKETKGLIMFLHNLLSAFQHVLNNLPTAKVMRGRKEGPKTGKKRVCADNLNLLPLTANLFEWRKTAVLPGCLCSISYLFKEGKRDCDL